jgi:large subunit ribosomal protein L25
METIKLELRRREQTGKSAARHTRAAGEIPGVVYGKGAEAVPVAISEAEFKRMRALGHTVVLELDFGEGDAKKSYAVIKELQMYPTRRGVRHVDLYEIDLTQEIESLVPVELVGDPPGVEEGGMMEFMHREVRVKARADRIPQSFSIDVSELNIGDNIRLDTIVVPEGVEILDDLETTVASLLAPRLAEPEVEVEGLEGEGEPELVGAEESSEESSE